MSDDDESVVDEPLFGSSCARFDDGLRGNCLGRLNWRRTGCACADESRHQDAKKRDRNDFTVR
jgi:hypothetical protein